MQMAKPNRIAKLKEKLNRNEPVIGSMVNFGDSAISELLASIGYDLIWIETEHTALDKKDIQLHMMAIQGAGAAAIVRVPWNDPVMVKPILDMGADGIIFPMIRTAADASLAVSSCVYPPLGIRGYGPIRASRYGIVGQNEYMNGCDIFKIMQIEHVEGVENLEDIVGTAGVDAIIVGVNDLSASIGRLGEPDHPEVKQLLATIGEVAGKTGIPFAAALYNPKGIQEWIELGINWIVVGGDIGFLKKSAEDALSGTKELFGKHGTSK